MNAIYNILTCVPALFALTNTLIHPLKLWKKAVIFCVFILGYVFLFPVISVYIPLVNLFGSWILLSILDSKHAGSNISGSFIGYVATVCIDYIMLFIFSVFGMTSDILMQDTNAYLLFCFIVAIVIYIATRFLGAYIRHLYFVQFHLDTLPLKIKRILFVDNMLGVIIVIFGIVHSYKYHLDASALLITGLLYISQFSVTVFIIYQIMKSTYREAKIEAEYELEKDYNARLEHANRETEKHDHDFNKTLSTLSYYFENNLIDEGKQWFHENICAAHEEYVKSKDQAVDMLKNIKSNEIKSILYNKIRQAIKDGADVHLMIPHVIDTIDGIKPFDLVRILSIYLDNALEAALETERKYLYISVTRDDISNSVSIDIQNSTTHTKIPHVEYGRTTKADGHGIGLINVDDILQRYPLIDKRTRLKDGLFIQTLDI